MKNGKFKIPDPKQQISSITSEMTKYTLGQQGYDFHYIKHLKPTFAFDYLSLNKEYLCFNSEYLVLDDYIGLLEGLKKLSKISYEELKRVPNYRFHSINFDDERVAISRKDFKTVLTFKEELLRDEELPTLYQIDFQYLQEARVCGFLYKGVFYLVWYDRFHEIYKKK